MKKLCLWLMTVCLLVCSVFAVACGKSNKGETTQEYVTLSKTVLSIEVYSQDTLTVTTNTDKEIEWTTSDAKVATVENGVISALSVGTATITATAGKVSASCALTVTPLSNFPELVVSESSLELVEGGESITVTASANYKGENIECDFAWESADPAVATVENGKVTPVAIGSTTITVTTECLGEVLVKEIPVKVSPDEQVQLSKSEMKLALAEINAGDITVDTVIAQAYKNGAVNADAALTFESSNAEVASVTVNGNEATVTAVSEGTCVISVYYESDKGKIQSFVEVTVARSKVALDTIPEIEYKGAETVLDFASLGLAGEFQGVYANEELVSDADGKLAPYFVEVNKASLAYVELHTSVAVYSLQINIAIHYFATPVMAGETSKVLPAYEGDVTAVGFEEGDSVYAYTVTGSDQAYSNRLMPLDVAKVPAFGHFIVEFSLSEEPTGEMNSGYIMTVWVGTTHVALVKGVGMSAYPFQPGNYTGSNDDHKKDSCVSIYDAEGKIPLYLYPNQKYYFEMHFEHADQGDIFAFAFNDALDVYVGESFLCTDRYYEQYIAPTRDNTPPSAPTPPAPELDYVMDGNGKKMDLYTGDVTAIGFTEGTEVYEQVQDNRTNMWDVGTNLGLSMEQQTVKLQKSVDQGYASIKFSLSRELTGELAFFAWWFDKDNENKGGAGYLKADGTYSASGAPTGFNAEAYDADGNRVTSFKANTVYELRWYGEGATAFNVGCCEQNGESITVYYAEPSNGNAELKMTVVQGDNRTPMPTYDGDVTELDFAEGTTVYKLENATPDNIYGDGWDKRAIISAPGTQDYITLEFVTMADITDSVFHVWGEKGSPSILAIWVTTTEDKGALITNMDGSAISGITAGKHYLVHIACAGLKEIQVGLISGGNTVYFANGAYNTGSLGGATDSTDSPVSQGENRRPMPTYDGDVTALGFAADTVVYQIVGPQSNTSDVKLVAKVDATGDKAYAKLDFVVSKSTTSLGLWITAENTHLGYYTVTPTGFTTDGLGDPSRKIFVTDANGESVTAFDANKVYTLYVGLDGREVTVQITTWADLTMYVANIACITEAEAPVEPAPPVQGKEISILFIGNSFSDDTEAYMVDILLNLGYTNINIGNLYIGGCSIDTHYENIMNNASAYDFRMRSHNGKKYTEYVPVSVGGEKRSIAFAIAYKDWDVISVQQASGESGKADSYKNLDALVAEVKKQATNSEVEIVFNMTWAYQGDSTHAQFPDYDSNQMTMYTAIVEAVQAQVKYIVVPNGTAIQNARTSLLGDTLTRDGYHLDLKIGRFIAGLTFVAKVTGVDIADLEYAPGGVNDIQFAIAIESVQNALANPFTVTESEIEEEVVEDPDVVAGGSNTTAVTLYKGDVTALGFAEGTTVYEYVGVDSSTDKAAIKVDSANYDYVEVQFVIAKGDGYFFLYGLKGGNWHNGGVSYVVDPGWIRLGDGKNTSSDRVIEIFDAAGNKVTSLMKTNVLYTLRVFTKVGELDEIRIAQSGATIYFANVKQGLESDIVDPAPTDNTVSQGDDRRPMPTYGGDVTALGFPAGTGTVYTIVATSNTAWDNRIIMQVEAGKSYVKFDFISSASISHLTMWPANASGTRGSYNVTASGSSTTDGDANRVIFIVDENGYKVTQIEAGKLYKVYFYLIDETNVQCSAFADTTVYVANIECGDGTVTPLEPTIPDEPTQEGGLLSGQGTALTPYAGDVTAFGFAAGTTVYEQVQDNRFSMWSPGTNLGLTMEQQTIKLTKSTDEEYASVQFSFSRVPTSTFVFTAWWLDSQGVNKGLVGYLKLDGSMHAMATDFKVVAYDMNGNQATGFAANTVYELRFYGKSAAVFHVGCCEENSESITVYYANPSSGNGTPAVDTTPTYSTDGGHTNEAATEYAGDVTALGFVEGTKVYEQKVADCWNDRVAITVDSTYDYVDIQVALTSNISFYIWINDETGNMIVGNYTVDASGNVSLASGALERKIQLLDANGNVITSAMELNKVYTLRIYIDGLTKVQLSAYSGAFNIYYGNITFGNDEV